MDGVLVESEHLWEELWTAFAARRGAAWTAEQTRTVQGMSAPEWAAHLAAFSGLGTDDGSVGATEHEVVDGMIAALEGGRIELLDGAREMVVAVSDRAPIALASSAPRRVIDAVLDHHGLTRRFTATVSSAEVPRGKPAPDVYLAAAERLGAAPARCLAVEDSSNGLRAAAAAGMTVVAIPNPTYPPAQDALAQAALAARDHAEVRDFLLANLAGTTEGAAR
ncbi:HAD family hydrolase [Mangrovactinospora gilvigrisea]|uniref:HAD family hydrolase n=2 Tax=Mangrovactinospora gilvigrisea TaxID=1428644 RepID=A0A1J7BAT3_9ACTN|nr:HAD family hydrolase [Mangrovactinospora gilvigrisea]